MSILFKTSATPFGSSLRGSPTLPANIPDTVIPDNLGRWLPNTWADIPTLRPADFPQVLDPDANCRLTWAVKNAAEHIRSSGSPPAIYPILVVSADPSLFSDINESVTQVFSVRGIPHPQPQSLYKGRILPTAEVPTHPDLVQLALLAPIAVIAILAFITTFHAGEGPPSDRFTNAAGPIHHSRLYWEFVMFFFGILMTAGLISQHRYLSTHSHAVPLTNPTPVLPEVITPDHLVGRYDSTHSGDAAFGAIPPILMTLKNWFLPIPLEKLSPDALPILTDLIANGGPPVLDVGAVGHHLFPLDKGLLILHATPNLAMDQLLADSGRMKTRVYIPSIICATPDSTNRLFALIRHELNNQPNTDWKDSVIPLLANRLSLGSYISGSDQSLLPIGRDPAISRSRLATLREAPQHYVVWNDTIRQILQKMGTQARREHTSVNDTTFARLWDTASVSVKFPNMLEREIHFYLTLPETPPVRIPRRTSSGTTRVAWPEPPINSISDASTFALHQITIDSPPFSFDTHTQCLEGLLTISDWEKTMLEANSASFDLSLYRNTPTRLDIKTLLDQDPFLLIAGRERIISGAISAIAQSVTDGRPFIALLTDALTQDYSSGKSSFADALATYQRTLTSLSERKAQVMVRDGDVAKFELQRPKSPLPEGLAAVVKHFIARNGPIVGLAGVWTIFSTYVTLDFTAKTASESPASEAFSALVFNWTLYLVRLATVAGIAVLSDHLMTQFRDPAPVVLDPGGPTRDTYHLSSASDPKSGTLSVDEILSGIPTYNQRSPQHHLQSSPRQPLAISANERGAVSIENVHLLTPSLVTALITAVKSQRATVGQMPIPFTTNMLLMCGNDTDQRLQAHYGAHADFTAVFSVWLEYGPSLSPRDKDLLFLLLLIHLKPTMNSAWHNEALIALREKLTDSHRGRFFFGVRYLEALTLEADFRAEQCVVGDESPVVTIDIFNESWATFEAKHPHIFESGQLR